MIKIYHNEKFNIKHIDLPSKPISSIYETVIIEFELLPQLEDILRYTILQLPNWNHTIICGFKNTHMIAEWNLPLRIITLPMDTLEPFEYNQLFMEESFWNRFEGTKLLFYTKDSIVLHSDLEEFIHYDFIPPNQQISFRDKNCMLKCIQTPTKIRITRQISNEMLTHNYKSIPEHIYFSTAIKTHSIGKLSPPEVNLIYTPVLYKPTIDYYKYPNLFHKFILSLSFPQIYIPYTIIQEYRYTNEFICHLHIFDLDLFEDIYGIYIENLMAEYHIIVTYIHSSHQLDYPITLLQIKNKGFDIGGKLCCLQYLKDQSIDYNYVLWLHSKSDPVKRYQYFSPLIKNKYRIKLCKMLMKYKNISGIFPNIIWCNCSPDHIVFLSNNMYYNELCEFLNIKPNYCFNEGNCFMCTKQVINTLFTDYMLFYNLLNTTESFDYSWVQSVFKDTTSSCQELYEKFDPTIHNMNTCDFRDGMIEHTIERMWIDVICHLNQDYLVLDDVNCIDMYKIKVNAIYFPQFHEFEENNTFWGKGFTEWTLLKPFQPTLEIDNVVYDTLKPHDDIGYYTLDVDMLQRQISMARKYEINGFIIYHYWFQKNHKVMYQPLEYFLNPAITFPFAISWANETWSKRWDGSNTDILIQQTYELESFLLHIQYLIQFFKRPNYIKNEKGECIFYIYNMNDIKVFPDMIAIWKTELDKHHLKIKIINTENGFGFSHNIYPENFIFEPMYSVHYTPIKETTEFTNMDYSAIIHNYKTNKYNLKGKHLGLPLYWNNKVRRKKDVFLNIKNFNAIALEELLLLLIAELVVKYKNISNLYTIPSHENFINVNAWNEWNEQAMLEPNNITGYENLTTISDVLYNL